MLLRRSPRCKSKPRPFAPDNRRRLGDKCGEQLGEFFRRRKPLAPANKHVSLPQAVQLLQLGCDDEMWEHLSQALGFQPPTFQSRNWQIRHQNGGVSKASIQSCLPLQWHTFRISAANTTVVDYLPRMVFVDGFVGRRNPHGLFLLGAFEAEGFKLAITWHGVQHHKK